MVRHRARAVARGPVAGPGLELRATNSLAARCPRGSLCARPIGGTPARPTAGIGVVRRQGRVAGVRVRGRKQFMAVQAERGSPVHLEQERGGARAIREGAPVAACTAIRTGRART